MTKSISGICIQNNKLLVVSKKGAWILPGGKLNLGEDDHDCLVREVREELGVEIEILFFYDSFSGVTPFTKDSLTVKTYFIKIIGQPKPQAEICAIKWVNNLDLKLFEVTEVTKKIINSLQRSNHLI